MLMIRLQRIGRKNDPSFRIIVTDKRESTKSTRFADIVGTYQPKAGTITIEADKVKQWMAKGAQPSPTVHNMLITKGIITGKKINVLPKKTPIIKEAPVVEAPAVAEVVAEEAAVEVAPAAEEVVVEQAPAEVEPTPAAPAATEEVASAA